MGRKSAAAPQSAGILLFRRTTGELEVLLGHPGGPFWSRRDEGAWSVPKGLVEPGEDPLDAARRELCEETGLDLAGAPDASFLPLGEVRLRSGKIVHAWAFEHDCDPASLSSNDTEIEWPPRSGRRLRVPEVDRFELFGLGAAARKIAPAQLPLLDRLSAALDSG
ncbi:MAG TPA: NUDIX domain-containing protein [Thermoanaerobaculia bacterium]|nr:NUDIX domain-containing protein [Thermoanaerobaculia bacterium]